MIDAYKKVLHFWFEELKPNQWYEKNKVLDDNIRINFGALHKQAIAGELSNWRDNILGRLAEIIIFDQFSRNIFRGLPQSFAYDSLALILAQEAVRTGEVSGLPENMRAHILLPYMHSESKIIHEIAVELYKEFSVDPTWEIRHKVIIDRFGRYPHRNAILGRKSTPEEIEFLKGSGSSF